MNNPKQPDNHCTCDPDNIFIKDCNNEPTESHLCPYKESCLVSDLDGEYCNCCLDCTAECEASS